MEDFNLEMPDLNSAFAQILNELTTGEEEQSLEIPEDHSLILLMGLDESGKTSLINQYIYHEEFKPPPTGLVDHSKYTHNGEQLIFREVGGRFRFRDNWPTLYENAAALIWVVDMIDRGRIIESREELEKVLNHDLIRNLPILIVLNKIDSRIKMTRETCEELLQTSRLLEGRQCQIIETTSKTCENLKEAFDWLVSKIPSKKNIETDQE